MDDETIYPLAYRTHSHNLGKIKPESEKVSIWLEDLVQLYVDRLVFDHKMLLRIDEIAKTIPFLRK